MNREQVILCYFILLAHRFDLAQLYKKSNSLTEHELLAYVRKYGTHQEDNSL